MPIELSLQKNLLNADAEYGFHQYSRAWYARLNKLSEENVTEEIMVGLYSRAGGCYWEFAIRWYNLSKAPTPRVEVFCDAWQAFSEISWLFSELSQKNSLTPEECCELLKSGGFTDKTALKSPYAPKSAIESRESL